MSPTVQFWMTVIGAALGVLALLLGIGTVLARQQLTVRSALRARLLGLARSNAERAVAVLRRSATPNGWLDRLLKGHLFTDVVTQALQRSGLSWTPARFTWLVILGMAAGTLSAIWLPPALALTLGILGGTAPFLLVAIAHRRRVRKVEEQLPDAIEMLVNALKAGYSLQAGMSFVGAEMAPPIGPEFSRFYDEQRLGMEMRLALDNLHTRLGTLEARMFVLALLMQRETGGNLSEILENIAKLVRDRIDFRGQVDVLTSESKMSAMVLAVLPLIMFVLIQFISPAYTATLTSTATGQQLLLYAFVSLVIGAFVLRRMSHIES